MREVDSFLRRKGKECHQRKLFFNTVCYRSRHSFSNVHGDSVAIQRQQIKGIFDIADSGETERQSGRKLNAIPG